MIFNVGNNFLPHVEIIIGTELLSYIVTLIRKNSKSRHSFA